jgi:hypothetical protein
LWQKTTVTKSSSNATFASKEENRRKRNICGKKTTVTKSSSNATFASKEETKIHLLFCCCQQKKETKMQLALFLLLNHLQVINQPNGQKLSKTQISARPQFELYSLFSSSQQKRRAL